MDNKRIVFWGALGALLWLNVLTWQRDYPSAADTVPVSTTSPVLSDTMPSPTTSSSASSASTNTSTTPQQSAAVGSKIHVVTDVLDLDINTRGGDIERADLLKYVRSREEPNKRVRLLDDQPEDFFAIHSGLSSANPAGAPSHLALFSTESSSYQLATDKDELIVDLNWADGQGINITKSFVFHRGSYAIDLRYQVSNASISTWQAASYVELYRHDVLKKRSMFDADTMSYRGPAVYDGSKYQKLDLTSDKYRNYQNSFSGGWMAALQHHFVVAVVPSVETKYDYSLKTDEHSDFSITARGSTISISESKQNIFGKIIRWAKAPGTTYRNWSRVAAYDRFQHVIFNCPTTLSLASIRT